MDSIEQRFIYGKSVDEPRLEVVRIDICIGWGNLLCYGIRIFGLVDIYPIFEWIVE